MVKDLKIFKLPYFDQLPSVVDSAALALEHIS